MRYRSRRWCGYVALVCIAFASSATARLLLDPSGIELGALGAQAAATLDSARLVDALQGFARHPAREIGSEGDSLAARAIADTFASLGLQWVRLQRFSVPVAHQEYAYALLPRDEGGYDTVALRSYRPNFARTNTIPPTGLSGHLVYVRKGEEREYNGRRLDGSILLAEMTVENRWRLAATLGARAAIFIESDDPYIGVDPIFNTSVNFPRFWVPREAGLRLKAWAEEHPDARVILKARQPWKLTGGTNVVGFLPGSDPVMAREVVIITAPFDATSPVMGLSPGAEAALSIATELEIARMLAENPPPRSVLFAALDGQASAAMAGGRQFVLALKRAYPAALRRNMEFLRKDIRLLSDRKLAGKFPAFRARALALEDSLNRLMGAELADAEAHWGELLRARARYRTEGAPTQDRRGSALYEARRELSAEVAAAADTFLPTFERVCERFEPIIAAFGRLRRAFVDSLERDRRRLEPIVRADEGKIRTTLEGRLAAARLSDVNKALNKLTRISARDHLWRLQELRDQLALIRPVIERYPALVVDLSITSHSEAVGLFHKGYFYNQYPDLELQRAYGELGKRFLSYATNLVVVHDLERLWSMSDDSIRGLIWSKVAAISEKARRYRQIAHLTTADVEVVHSYAWYHRIFNVTAWLWGLAIAVLFVYRAKRWRDLYERAPPAWYWGMVVLGAAFAAFALIEGVDWKQTTRIYHGIDRLMWEHTDLLVEAEQIPREDKTRIRLAAEKHRRYTEITEAPEFFAKNIIAAIPATIAKLKEDSAGISQQLHVFARIARLRAIPPERLSDEQLDSLNRFIGFLGLQGDRRFVNAITGAGGKRWNHFLPTPRYFTSEIATLAGIPAIALATLDDAALLRNTVHDSLHYVHLPGFLAQARMVTSLMTQALWDPRLPDDIALGDYFAEAHGVVLFDDRTSSVAADVPVDSAIVIADRGAYRFLALSDLRGSFDFYGLPIDGRSWVRSPDTYWLHAYKVSPDSGHITFAVDLGSEQYAFEPTVGQMSQEWMVVVFPCASLSVTGLMDQRYFQYLARGDVYDARTDAKPWHYFAHVSRGDNTFFMDPNTRVKLIFAQGILGIRAMLTGVPEKITRLDLRQGLGFPVKAETLLTHTTYQAARDMWELNEGRLRTLVRHGIIDEETRAVHESAAKYLAEARTALEQRRYDAYLTAARTALALESRVLPDVLGIANGALKGVLFYMALLLPFAFFLERLLIGATDVRHQALWFFGIFLLMFFLIEQVHPAFDITVAPPMVLLAFTVFALSIFVVAVIIGKFTAQMRQIRKEQQGYLSADVGRLSAMFTAFLLGVSNMRKRKMRTTLTCATLILLTFTVLSFTSVREYLRVNEIRLSKERPLYSGVMIRDRFWNFWPREMLPDIRNELGHGNIVVGRVWREAILFGADYFFTLEAENGKRYTLSGFVGMEPDEDKVTGIFQKAGIAGRWFREDDLHALVIPRTAAHALDIPLEAVTGDVATAPKVRMEGIEYAIIGVLDDEALRHIKDLDGEELTSVNWQLVAQQRMGRIQQLQQMQKESRQQGERDTFVHLVPAQCMFMPMRAVAGGLISVAIRTPDYAAAKALVERVIPKWALEMYVGQEDGAYLYSAIGLTTLGGLKDVLIPILIAALIVLNTMLGAVYERTREIGIFSAVGLAPSHIAMLFMAEATVYAVLGAIAGYLLGQTVGQIVYKAGILGGITLNYSSLSTITSTLIVMLTVLLSTIYPAKKASEMSVPDIARTWKLPEPDGDEWFFALPFTLIDEELEGLNAFLAHYFESHHDESSSDFYVDRVGFWSQNGAFVLETTAWLAPYDLGVSELVSIITTPVPEEENLYRMSLLVIRETGDVPSWTRVNRRFVNFLRKQFLIWRALSPEERGRFIVRGKEMFGTDGGSEGERVDLTARA